MERKLVTIRKVNNLSPIEGADFIELAHIDGWRVIVKKCEFKIDDYGLYFEVDSFLPIEPRYEFLRKSSYRKLEDGSEGFRLKTMKMKKELSQGLLLPLKEFPEISEIDLEKDYSELLKVTKYEPPMSLSLRGLAKGNFPFFIRKTDEERIQNLPKYFTEYRNVYFEASEKIDGSSMTAFHRDGEFGVCSRNLELKEDDQSVFWQIVNDLDLRRILTDFGKNIAIQGELAGPGIQKNRLSLEELTFFIYNVWDIDKQVYLTPNDRFKLLNFDIKIYDKCEKIWHVPIIYEAVRIFMAYPTMDDILKASEIKSIVNPKVSLEGIVYKSHVHVFDRLISFKAINNQYLLQETD